MLSEESAASFTGAFVARIESVSGEECACGVFPEITDNPHTALVVESCMDSVGEAFVTTGDLAITSEAMKHALVAAMSYGMAYGRLDLIGDAPDAVADGYSWDLSDEQLSKLAESDYWSE